MVVAPATNFKKDLSGALQRSCTNGLSSKTIKCRPEDMEKMQVYEV